MGVYPTPTLFIGDPMKIISEYQEVFLKLVMSGNYLNLMTDIPIHAFDKDYQPIVIAIQKRLKKFASVTPTSIKQVITSEEESIIDEIMDIDIPDEGVAEVLDSVNTYVRTYILQKAVASAIGSLEKGDLELAETTILNSLGSGYTDTDESGFYFQTSLRKKREKEVIQKEIFKTLLPSLDKMFDYGGWLRGQLILIAGRLGTGKSYFLTWLTDRLVIQGKKGLYINLEMTIDEQVDRLDSAMLHMPPKDIRSMRRKTIRKLKFLQQKYGDCLYITELPPQKTNMLDIKRIINDLKRQGFEIDFLVVDGADYLSPVHPRGNHYYDSGVPYLELKRLGVEEKILVLADCQVHRQEAETDNLVQGFIGTENIAHSYLRAMVATSILALNQTKQEYKNGLMRIGIPKSRSKGKKWGMVKLGMSTEYIHIFELTNTTEINLTDVEK